VGPQFVDTNIFLRHLLQDLPDQSPRATAYLRRIHRGDVQAETSTTVFTEVIFTLERSYKTPKADIRNLIVDLLAIEGLYVANGSLVREALDIYVDKNVSFADAFNAAQMTRRGISEVVSFDRDFDRILGITRIEP